MLISSALLSGTDAARAWERSYPTTKQADAAIGGQVATYRLLMPFMTNSATFFSSLDSRFGIVTSSGMDRRVVVDLLKASAYYDYRWGEPVVGKDYLQTVSRDGQTYNGFDDFVRSHRGLYWQVGNEPNVPNQDNVSAAAYAQRYNAWVTRIKALDPMARVMNGGIVNWPDVVGDIGAGLAYLRDFRESYRSQYGQYPPIDVWNLHTYAPFAVDDGRLRTYCDSSAGRYFIVQVTDYLRDAGQTQPVWLTEFGLDWNWDSVPQCYDPTRRVWTTPSAFMIEMVDWLRSTGLVARWFWFSDNAWDRGNGGALVDRSTSLTTLGQTYRDLAVGIR
ncbi:MAG: hypothetical protein HY675_09115 [Chloroflexi bacterium]|nr:hypothetical protein [Chloroflexota bacterium]